MFRGFDLLYSAPAQRTPANDNGEATLQEQQVREIRQGQQQESQQTFTIKQEIIKAQLERAFMKPLDGSKSEECSMGHKLELPIALDWIRDIHERNLFHGFRFKIIALYKVGLVAKKLQPIASIFLPSF